MVKYLYENRSEGGVDIAIMKAYLFEAGRANIVEAPSNMGQHGFEDCIKQCVYVEEVVYE